MRLTPRWKVVRVLLVTGLVGAGLFAVAEVAPAAAAATTNLVTNPSLETVGVNNQPACFTTYGYGSSTVTAGLTTAAHTGSRAMAVTLAKYVSGDYKVMNTQSTACAPQVVAGHTYNASVWYNGPKTNLTAFTYTTSGGWAYWTELGTFAASTSWRQAASVTPPIPAGVTAITFGLSVAANGKLTTDDYALTDTAPPAPAAGTCIGTADQCAKGQWTVLSFPNHSRAIHTVVLQDGRILFMAGSGNDPNMSVYSSSLWNPGTNTWTDVPVPYDVFCAGHVQLPNGNVLLMGGNKAYPVAGGHGYEGLKSSYIFNVATSTYQQVNDMNTGHWYPSATELGNGNVLSMGGLNENGEGTVTNEMFDTATSSWLSTNQVPQQYNYFGLYPANVLTSTGKVFYSGSHVFGNSPTPGGAAMIDLTANTITTVPGLQNINNRDQSAAVLLPPAQAQRVLVMGGGNVDTNVDANRLTDLIDLTSATPAYTPGPLLKQGTTEAGNMAGMSMTDSTVTPETGAQGKMYVSAVLTPDRQVLETGGGLHNRADPVYEASVYNPVANTFTSMNPDPVERMYHSESVLYQDGTVISVGSNPGDGSFDMRISVFKPPYLFKAGRPTITAPAVSQWNYGSSQSISGSDDITSAELIKPAAVTHSSDPNQRLIDLPLTRTGAGRYTVAMTANSNLAPPGWYMLFVQNAGGQPSTAQWVHVGGN